MYFVTTIIGLNTPAILVDKGLTLTRNMSRCFIIIVFLVFFLFSCP